MIFQDVNQFELAKKMLIEKNRDIKAVFESLRDNEEFSDLSEAELYSAIKKLDEGFGDKLLNFLGGFKGDISKLKTVLNQMKEQELKFNKEEFDIYNQFYALIQDQKALDKDKKNPNYDALNAELARSRNALNIRMKELTKSHNQIFDALEEKVKSLVKDNKRKKKFFNSQRANDVLITKTDRYEKIKAIIAKNLERSDDLNAFFGISPEKVKKDVENAKEQVEKIEKNITSPSVKSTGLIFKEEPEKGYGEKLTKIIESPGGYYAKRRELEAIISTLQDYVLTDEFKAFGQEKKINIHLVLNQANDYLTSLEREEKKIKSNV